MTDFKRSQIIKILEEQKSKSNKEKYDYDINEAYDVSINLLKAHDLVNENDNVKNCLNEIIEYMNDDTVYWRDISDDIINDILKKYGFKKE